MAVVNVSETEFLVVACAARDAKDRGDDAAAHVLDKLARKINAALTTATTHSFLATFGMRRQTVRWQDMPSTLDEIKGPTS